MVAMPEEVDWPVLLGEMILTKNEIAELDEENLEPFTVPREKLSPAELEALERRLGERLPDGYRQFLLHASGWPRFYFRVDLFGVPELQGEGNWSVANELLQVYEEQDVLDDLGLDPDGVIPVAAGQGMRDLFLLIREGWPGAGQVSWIDGEEIDRYADFAEFIASMTEYNRRYVERLRAGEG
jgi:hypothetical protein